MDNSQIPSIVIGKLLNIGAMLQREGNRILQPFDLNQQQFSLFFEIAQSDKVKQKDVVNRLLLEKAHVSKVVKKLQKMKLITITVSDEDRRSAWLAVTPKGRKTLNECMTIFKKWNNEWLEPISDKELNLILNSLTKIQTVFKEKIL